MTTINLAADWFIKQMKSKGEIRTIRFNWIDIMIGKPSIGWL